MADTATEPLPNGNAATAEEEDERMKQRPADIDADVREMERRKRVEALMSSRLFREELERVLDQQMHEGGDAPLLQRIREMVGGRLHTGTFRSPSCVLPINDIRGIEGFGYEKGEKILRCKLAACYRLVDLFGWTQTGINGQITARLNTAVEQVLTTPRGLLPHEVTASSLVKVDMQGVVQDQGTTNFPVNVEGFSLHASVHAARPDLRCVLHVRAAAALAVSSARRGLLPLCQEAAVLGDIAYHRVPHGLLDNEEHEKLVRALGPSAKVLVLSGAGALCGGASLEEAFHLARQLVAACDVQLRLAAVPTGDLHLLDDDTRQKMYEQARTAPAGDSKWRAGGEEFEALMRMLDNAGFRTGYIYRHPLIKNEVPKPKNDVEVPPAVSSLGYLLEEEELYRQGIWKRGHGKTGERTRWLNSPNVYQKVEVLETGTNDPKKITKWVDANNEEWVQDGSPAHSSTPVKIDTLQFVPKNTNPKEFKALQQQIKDNRRADKISAGPQSHILEGVSWDEASRLVGEDAANTHTGDHVVLMGAASKGIIQRGHQHNATMYSAPYARNPFEHVTDSDIDEYRRLVERRARPDYDTDLSESEAISAAQITSPASAPSETEEESRDEHRVLRIETKQVPVRSQPEVVLSDVDTTDFLHAERAHVDRTRDPNLLSDEEVFLDSPAASTASSAVTSPAPLAVVRVTAGVIRGTNIRPEANEALSTSKRSINNYSRNNNVVTLINKYDDDKKHPKCKVSLNDRLGNETTKADDPDKDAGIRFSAFDGYSDDSKVNDHGNIKSENDIVVERIKIGDGNEPLDLGRKEQGTLSSRSSLYSIPSIEWDGRCKSEYTFRTQSLPRKVKRSTNLFRTRSYSGFPNSYIKDPEPHHFHIPKCRSCGSSTNSYVWDLAKEKKPQKSHAVYFSVDNIHQECNKEDVADIVKIKEKNVPIFKVADIKVEFVESQEFNEDNYLADLNSFSSENETVIEKGEINDITITEVNTVNDSSEIRCDKDSTIYKAELVIIQRETSDEDSNANEGGYHSFSDDMDFEGAYESPVKDLVEKDIRDYSVPINFYCEDYAKKESPKKSPKKIIEVVKQNLILEPILEESKSSYDESNSSSNDTSNKRASDVDDMAERNNDVRMLSNVNCSDDKSTDKIMKIVSDSAVENAHQEEIIKNDTVKKAVEKTNVILTTMYTTDTFEVQVQEDITNVIEGAFPVFNSQNDVNIFKVPEQPRTDISKFHSDDECQRKSNEYSIASSTELVSFNSTAEFEKYEIITDILSNILNKLDFETNNRYSVSNLIRAEEVERKFDSKNSVVEEKCDVADESDTVFVENFSITKMILEIEGTSILNETMSTEISDVDSKSYKIAESIVYFIFSRACSLWENKNKTNMRVPKTVVTVVDGEDIMFTAISLWPDDSDNLNNEVHLDEQQESKNDCKETEMTNIAIQLDDSNLGQNMINNFRNNQESDTMIAKVFKDGFQNDSSKAEVIEFDNITNLEHNIKKKILDSSVCFEPVKSVEKASVRDDTGTNLHQTSVWNGNDDINVNSEVQMQDTIKTETDAIDNLFQYLDEELKTNEDKTDFSKNTDLKNELDDGFLHDHSSKLSISKEAVEDDEQMDISCCNLRNDNRKNNIPDSDEIIEDFINIDYNDDHLNNNDNTINNVTIETAQNAAESTYSPDLVTNVGILNDTFEVPPAESSNETFVIVPEDSGNNETFLVYRDMNTAFVQEDYLSSRSSSPQRDQPGFVACTESPIVNTHEADLSALYEKEDSIVGSPFVKRASVISMSQTEHKGGVKYWVSFDESFTDNTTFKSVRKYSDNTVPSFFTVDLDSNSYNDGKDFKRASILLEDFSKLDDSNVAVEESFASAKFNSDNYETCDSEVENEPRKMLLYDSRPDLHSKSNKRLYSSWPPYEDTLFYRIISKYRMSESFDPSDLENVEKSSDTF